MATILDVAKKANVSIATVSRVINKQDKVKPSTRAKVLEAIKSLNYSPNSVARSLKTETTMNIGIIIQDIANEHLANFCSGLSNVVTPHHYIPLIASTNNQAEVERDFLQSMMNRRVDGLVIHSCGSNNKLISEISKIIPTVALYRRVNSEAYAGDFIDNDNREPVYLLTKQLIEKGHRRIFIINGPLNVSTGYERFSGFIQAMGEIGITVDSDYPYQYESNFLYEGGIRGCENMLLKKGVTALVTTNAELLLGALTVLDSKALNIPSDYSVVSYAQPASIKLFKTPITCAEQNSYQLGQNAAEMLLSRIQDSRIPPREQLFPAPIMNGRSIAQVDSNI